MNKSPNCRMWPNKYPEKGMKEHRIIREAHSSTQACQNRASILATFTIYSKNHCLSHHEAWTYICWALAEVNGFESASYS